MEVVFFTCWCDTVLCCKKINNAINTINTTLTKINSDRNITKSLCKKDGTLYKKSIQHYERLKENKKQCKLFEKIETNFVILYECNYTELYRFMKKQPCLFVVLAFLKVIFFYFRFFRTQRFRKPGAPGFFQSHFDVFQRKNWSPGFFW